MRDWRLPELNEALAGGAVPRLNRLMRNMRDIMQIVEGAGIAPVLYHGTCPENAEAILQNGWAPRPGRQMGPNGGQPHYLYLSTDPEDARWFAQERGCDTVIEVHGVPLDCLKVDPEDGTGDTLEDELNLSHGLPSKVVLVRALSASHFRPHA